MGIDHQAGMARAIELGRHNPGAPFGAVILDEQRAVVLAEGVNAAGESPTRHGEMVAIDAWAASGGRSREGAVVLYTTAEPCPMCMSAILWARIETVVFGTSIPSLVRAGWRQIDIRAAEIERRTPFTSCTIVEGVREADCDRLFAIQCQASSRCEGAAPR